MVQLDGWFLLFEDVMIVKKESSHERSWSIFEDIGYLARALLAVRLEGTRENAFRSCLPI